MKQINPIAIYKPHPASLVIRIEKILAATGLFLLGAILSIPAFSQTTDLGHATGENFCNEGRGVYTNLGGMNVFIPSQFAKYTEYDAEPAVENLVPPGKSRTTRKPPINSFGFDFKYPDMTGICSKQDIQEKIETSLRSTPWMFGGLNSGSIFSGPNFLESIFHQSVIRTPLLKSFTYTKMPDKVYGLDHYANLEIDPTSKKRMREDHDIEDLYFHRDKDGKIKTCIRCSAATRNFTQTCLQEFSLLPHSRSEVSVRYAFAHLKNWKDIQAKTTELILSFKVNEAQSKTK